MADPKQIADALAQDQLLAQFNRNEGQAQPWYMKPMDMEGRATFLPFKDTLPGSVMNQRELALPGLLAGAVNAFTAPGRVSTQGFDAPEEAQNLAMNVMGGGITTGKMMRNPTGVGGTDLALNVYHGTPHEIKGGFDLAKVGTGEGAQAYGHGMYFAENPAVAQQYQKDISRSQLMKGGDPVRLDQTISGKPLTNFYESISTKADRMPYEKAAVEYEKMSFIEDLMQGTQFKDAIARIDNPSIVTWAKSLESSYKPAGNLYKADIPDAAIPMMLNWDKPLYQQPGILQNIKMLGERQDMPKGFNQALEKALESKHFDGQDLYYELTKIYKNPVDLSKAMEESGFTGIRYLDELSRTSGKGTSNFVVFKPETVDILERNGVPTRKELLQQEFDKLDK